MNVHVGIDNGTTGSIGVICVNGDSIVDYTMFHTPTIDVMGYQKEPRPYKRIHLMGLRGILAYAKSMAGPSCTLTVVMEKPYTAMVAVQQATLSAYAYEATLIALELEGLTAKVISSVDWQRPILGKGKDKMGRSKLKAESLKRAHQLFPKLDLRNYRDADGILIALYSTGLSIRKLIMTQKRTEAQ